MPLATRAVFCLLLLVVVGQGGAAHITDKLVVGLYAGPGSEGAVLRLLPSGTPLDVLQQRDGFAEVRLADQLKGWVESRYVSEEKPAKAMLLETQARLRHLGLQLAELKASCPHSDPGDAVLPTVAGVATDSDDAQPRQAPDSTEAGVARLRQQVAEQPPASAPQQQLDQLRQRVRQALLLLGDIPEINTPVADPETGFELIWRHRLWIGGLLAGLLGFVAGVVLVDYRHRKRHGGFRI